LRYQDPISASKGHRGVGLPEGPFGNPRGPRGKSLPALSTSALNEPVYATINGKRRKIANAAIDANDTHGADAGTIRGLLKVYGLKIGAIHRNRFAARVLELLEMGVLPDLSAAIEPLLRVRKGMRTGRKALDRALAAATRRSDAARRIHSVGPVTTLAHIVTIGDPGRFGNSKALGAHLGPTPRVYQSGEIDRSGQISKCSDRMLRHLLFTRRRSGLGVSPSPSAGA